MKFGYIISCQFGYNLGYIDFFKKKKKTWDILNCNFFVTLIDLYCFSNFNHNIFFVLKNISIVEIVKYF